MVTASQNQLHSYRILKNIPSMKNRFGEEHVRAVKINQYTKQMKHIANWNSIIDASKKLNINASCICNVLKRRRIDSAEAEFAKYTYLAHPFAPKNGLRLLDDINLDKVLSLQSLSNDMDVLPDKEKANAVPRLQTLSRTPFDEEYE
jgi:hypothetical protein